jgi:hypothetical protein
MFTYPEANVAEDPIRFRGVLRTAIGQEIRVRCSHYVAASCSLSALWDRSLTAEAAGSRK